MGQRGRTSVAALSVVAGSIDGRPKPPEDLTEYQVEVWQRTVAGEASEMFGTAALQQILKEYCRHVATAHLLTEEIDRALIGTNRSLTEMDILLRMRDRETKALADKATKLRLTNQSRYTPGAAATASKKAPASKPWAVD